VLERLPVRRARVFTGQTHSGMYNHHADIVKFHDRYYCSWHNGLSGECLPGQRIMISSSADGIGWTPAKCTVPGDPDAGIIPQAGGLYADDAQMVLYVRTRKGAGPAGSTERSCSVIVDAWVSADGESWATRPGIISAGRMNNIHEAPRPTASGSLLSSGAIDGKPVAYRWDPREPAREPEIIGMPEPDEADLVFGEHTWYQTDDGTIVVFCRDCAGSGYLFVAFSRDDGATWTKPCISDFPDADSKVYAGRLPDGRFYIVGNSHWKVGDRSRLMIAIANDGLKFGEMHVLLEDPPQMRQEGRFKNRGYQYPSAVVDEGKLLVAYSVNKEDIECGYIDHRVMPSAV